MAEIRVEKKRTSVWVWIVLLLILIAAATAFWIYSQENRPRHATARPAATGAFFLTSSTTA